MGAHPQKEHGRKERISKTNENTHQKKNSAKCALINSLINVTTTFDFDVSHRLNTNVRLLMQ